MSSIAKMQKLSFFSRVLNSLVVKLPAILLPCAGSSPTRTAAQPGVGCAAADHARDGAAEQQAAPSRC